MVNTILKSVRGRQRGFTLVELMIVTVIVAILAAVGYPSYIQYITRSNRQAARASLYRIADRQEQFFIDNKSYAPDLSTLGFPDDTVGIGRDGQEADGGDVIYNLSISDADALSYTVQAEPQGLQAERDTACGTLSLTNAGVRDQTGGGDRCW